MSFVVICKKFFFICFTFNLRGCMLLFYQALHKIQVFEAAYEQLKVKVEQEIANKGGSKVSQKQLNKMIVDLTEVITVSLKFIYAFAYF
jgi:hypothetical protein